MHKLLIKGAPLKLLEYVEFVLEQFLFVGIPLLLFAYFQTYALLRVSPMLFRNIWMSSRVFMFFQIMIHYFKMNSYFKMNRDYRLAWIKVN